ncbi:MAG TPA: rRNA maturation RNase YbeY [Candidatus Eremiobacteraceae bacterium]|nr:rRNA maturation RNase YbeY [Candidatus Eremiobacteraceae bacterium]
MSDSHGPRVFVTMPRLVAQGRAGGFRSPTAARLRRVTLHVLGRAAPQVVGDVTVLVTDDHTMRGLNRRYRSKDATTDVLAFPLGDGLRRDEPWGDVVISYETARRQARRYGATIAEEMSRLLIHGLLHLCGHDHHERAQAARMHGLTRRLVREVQVGSTTSGNPRA